jgi:7-carboxy-7-deazaguanine synthase
VLKVKDIIFDIQEETTFIGFPSVYIHLENKGNELTSTEKTSDSKASSLTVEEILDEVSKYNSYIIVITSCDPLDNKDINDLITALVNKNYLVLIETKGTQTIKNINNKALIILEVKCPDSIDFNKFMMENLKYIRPKDQLKFIISSSRDYHWAKDLIFKEMLFEKCNLLFFVDEKNLTTRTLADWIITDQLPIRLGCKRTNLFK